MGETFPLEIAPHRDQRLGPHREFRDGAIHRVYSDWIQTVGMACNRFRSEYRLMATNMADLALCNVNIMAYDNSTAWTRVQVATLRGTRGSSRRVRRLLRGRRA